MRILIATPLYPPDIGGPAKYAEQLQAEFERRGVSAGVVVWGRLERVLPWGVRHLLYALRLVPRMMRSDIILALDTWSVGLPALCAAWLFRKKLALRIGGDFLWEQYVERTGDMVKLSDFYRQRRTLSFKERVIYNVTGLLVRQAQVLFFNTAWQLELWQRAYGFDRARASVLENEYPSQQAAHYAEPRTFVAAGRGIRYKNIPAGAAAFKAVAARYEGIAFDTEPLPPERNAERLRQAYAVMVPSVSEVNSNFLIEGLSYGKPFIAPQDSGMAERLEGLGLFVDTLDDKALEGAIEILINPERYRAYAERIKAFTYTHSWSDIAEELLTTLKRI